MTRAVWRRIFAVARKESLHIMRDPRSLGMAIAIPMLLLLLFGYALTLDVDRVRLAVWDQEQSPASREVVSHFLGSRYFSLRAYPGDYAAIERGIDRGDIQAALVIPRGFARKSGGTAPLQFLVDGSDSTTATMVLGYAETIAQRLSLKTALRVARRGGCGKVEAPVELRPRVWYNADMESRNYIIPGLIAVIMMVIAALLTSLTVAREWEQGTMEQLIATPVRGWELITGKLLPYFMVGMLDVVLAVLLGEYLFKVPLRGSVALLFGMAALFLAGALALGMVISIVTKSQLLASQLAMVMTFLPSFLLSGFMYSIGNMPAPIRVATRLIPARYFVTLLKGIYLKGVGLRILALEAALLSLFGTVVVALAVFKFKKRLE